MNSSTPLQAHAFCDVSWQNQPHHFAVALVNEALHFWDAEGEDPDYLPGAPLFVVLEQIRVSRSAIINPRFVYHAFNADWERICEGEVPWARIIPFDDETDIVLRATGEGEVRYRDVRKAPFQWNGDLPILEGSISQWEETLQLWAKYSDSDFSFALRCAKLDYIEQGKLLVGLSHGNWSEMERVATWIAYLEGDSYYSSRGHTHHETYAAIEIVLECQSEDGQWTVDHFHQEQGDKAYLPLWQTWFDFFGPYVHSKVVERYTIARERAKNGMLASVETPITLRSAHEQMETRLQLRDWLRERAELPEECIAELLR